VNSTVAGTRLRGLYIAVSRSSRASGTFEIPTEVSSLPCPLPRAGSRPLVIRWKSVVLPLDVKPMRAARSMRSAES
jgi:hypothetical protein